ncbi:hypothetical protein AM1BK_50470 [Neobacillus kokaensis]|uniref:Uncharacterized protein n=1 Tax=Neobacillus kokaensis TaxID=2759023 RepID=A0ABQ3NC52_9BACI|nr:hypothetical protein AM1BK_50470 [Neobacillus kokaensis]
MSFCVNYSIFISRYPQLCPGANSLINFPSIVFKPWVCVKRCLIVIFFRNSSFVKDKYFVIGSSIESIKPLNTAYAVAKPI